MHIDDKKLNTFQDGTLDSQNMIAFLEHLDHCDFCLNQMIQQEEVPRITAPSYLKEQILSKASSPEVQVVKAASETSRKMQLLYFSLHTAIGVLAALFLLFCIGTTDFSLIKHDHIIQTERNQEITKKWQGNQLYDFTQGIGQGITNNTSSVTHYLNNIFK